MTIDGPGSSTLTVRGNGSGSVFTVNAGVTATLYGLTITGGGTVSGAGIANAGNLTLADDSITGNTATLEGGGIWNTGSLAVVDSTISNNRAVWGAGIANSGTLDVERSTIWNNTAVGNNGKSGTNAGGGGGGGGGLGGGVYNTGTATLVDSTLAGNTAQGGPGGNSSFPAPGALQRHRGRGGNQRRRPPRRAAAWRGRSAGAAAGATPRGPRDRRAAAADSAAAGAAAAGGPAAGPAGPAGPAGTGAGPGGRRASPAAAAAAAGPGSGPACSTTAARSPSPPAPSPATRPSAAPGLAGLGGRPGHRRRRLRHRRHRPSSTAPSSPTTARRPRVPTSRARSSARATTSSATRRGAAGFASTDILNVAPKLGPLAEQRRPDPDHGLARRQPGAGPRRRLRRRRSSISAAPNAGRPALDAGAHADIGAYEASSSYLVTTTADTADVGSLRAGIAWAEASTNPLVSWPGPQTWSGSMRPGAFATAQTLELTTVGDTTVGPTALAITGNVEIDGPVLADGGLTLSTSPYGAGDAAVLRRAGRQPDAPRPDARAAAWRGASTAGSGEGAGGGGGRDGRRDLQPRHADACSTAR